MIKSLSWVLLVSKIRGGNRPESKRRGRPTGANLQQPQQLIVKSSTITKVLENASEEIMRGEEERESIEFAGTAGPSHQTPKTKESE